MGAYFSRYTSSSQQSLMSAHCTRRTSFRDKCGIDVLMSPYMHMLIIDMDLISHSETKLVQDSRSMGKVEVRICLEALLMYDFRWLTIFVPEADLDLMLEAHLF